MTDNWMSTTNNKQQPSLMSATWIHNGMSAMSKIYIEDKLFILNLYLNIFKNTELPQIKDYKQLKLKICEQRNIFFTT